MRGNNGRPACPGPPASTTSSPRSARASDSTATRTGRVRPSGSVRSSGTPRSPQVNCGRQLDVSARPEGRSEDVALTGVPECGAGSSGRAAPVARDLSGEVERHVEAVVHEEELPARAADRRERPGEGKLLAAAEILLAQVDREPPGRGPGERGLGASDQIRRQPAVGDQVDNGQGHL